MINLTSRPTSDILRLISKSQALLTSYLTMTYTIQIRPKRQATFPSSLLEALGVGIGDSLKVTVKNKKAVVQSNKQVALDALREIQRIFKESGITEKEMLKNAEKIRKELYEDKAS